MQGKNARIKSFGVIRSNTLPPPLGSILYVFKKVDDVVCFSEIILYIVIFSGNAKLYKFALERSALFEETVDFPCDFHYVLDAGEL